MIILLFNNTLILMSQIKVFFFLPMLIQTGDKLVEIW